MKRLLVMMLMAASLAAVAPAIIASPAFATVDVRCNPSGPYEAPWWWGNVNAVNKTGIVKVLAVRPPFKGGSDAYLWSFNGELGQKWSHDCIGYDSVMGRNLWLLRYSANTTLCLTIVSPGYTALKVCSGENAQISRKVPVGPRTALTNIDLFNERCLEPLGGGTADGTLLVVERCHYGDSQRWY